MAKSNKQVKKINAPMVDNDVVAEDETIDMVDETVDEVSPMVDNGDMVRLMNVLPRTFNRIKASEIISVKSDEVDYYLDNGFNYFDRAMTPVNEEEVLDEETATQEKTSDMIDDADRILQDVQGA